MKKHARALALCAGLLWLFLGICPLAIQSLSEEAFTAPSSSASAAPTPSPTPPAENTAGFRIYDEATGEVLTVTEEVFLPLALLCEMSPDTPDEALKAQAVAILTTYSYASLHNSGNNADFTCNTEMRSIYAPAETFQSIYGDTWETVYARVSEICASVAGQKLYYEGELITAPFFAISAGCTQPYEHVWGGQSLPYLQAVACPSDLLFDGCRSTLSFTPEEIRAAFPNIAYTEIPENWFSAPQLYDTGYVRSIELCGTALSGTAVREALALRSAAFSVFYDGERFTFTTLGWGHGVGMSQAGAIYMAENGADYMDILAHFYPGTILQ